MRKIYSLVLACSLLASCTEAEPGQDKLSAKAFAEKIKTSDKPVVIDVRSTEEYEKGHLAAAKNYDWNGPDFDKQVATLDKNQTIMVYCLSGGRSASAAKKLRAIGFKQVYELDGGIMKWRAAKLPETSDSKGSAGLSLQQYQDLLQSNKLVLIDFYAEWCGPCKKMKPFLDEISKDMAAQVQIIRINADDNAQLCNDLKVDALPELKLYKNGQLQWAHTGFITKADLLPHLQ